MKKVLFTATVDSHILHFHIPYLKWFKEQGYEVHVATNGNEQIPYCDVKHKVTFERSPIKINNLKAIKQLKQIIDKEKFEIIHCHTPMGSVVTRIAAKKARKEGTRVIYTAHGFHFYKGAPILNWILFYPIEKWLSKYTDCLITINEEDFKLATKKFKAKRIELVFGVGVYKDKFNFELSESEQEKLRADLGIKKDDFVFIYAAELSKRKNQTMIINAMNQISKKYNNVKLILPGLDSMKQYYQKMVKKLNLEERILFLGYRKDIPKLMKISNAAISTSKQEGLPVNLIEAMFCGLPIIATNCRGNRDIVNNKENGYIINNTEELIEIMEKFLDEKKVEQINEASIEKLKQKYELSNVLKTMEKIYREVDTQKILHILASNIYSGAENVVITIINSFKNEKEMAYCSPKGKIEEKLLNENIKYFPIEKLTISKIKRVIKEYNPDIIHAHDYKASVITALSAKNKKIVSHLHNNSSDIKKWGLKSILYYMTIKKYNKIVVVSKSIQEEAVFGNKMKDKIYILPNYVDKIKVKRMAEKEKIEEKYTLGFIGRMSEIKNPLEFVEIVNEIIKKKDDINAVMVGDGDIKEKVQNKINYFGIQDKIKMKGFLENPYPIMDKCDVILMPSKWEGFGLVAIEALILGKKVLVSNVGGFKDIFAENNFYICNNRDEFVNKCIKLLDEQSENISIDRYTDYNGWKEELMKIYE